MTSPLSRHLRQIAEGLTEQHEKDSVNQAADQLERGHAQGAVSTTVDLKLLPENADERRMWDDSQQAMGWTALQRVGALLHASMQLAPEGGSYRETMAIAYNEVRKADAALREAHAEGGPITTEQLDNLQFGRSLHSRPDTEPVEREQPNRTGPLADRLDAATDIIVRDYSGGPFADKPPCLSGSERAEIVRALRAHSRSPAEKASIGDLTKIAADLHCTKWQFDVNDEMPLSAKEGRQLANRAFQQLHRIGDLAMKMRDEADTCSQPESSEVPRNRAFDAYRGAVKRIGEAREKQLADAIAERDRLRAQVEAARALPDTWEAKAKLSEHVIYDADMLSACADELRRVVTSTEQK